MIFYLILLVAIAVVVWFFPAIYATLAQYIFRPVQISRKNIAITFDDGPNSPYTEDLLRVLNKHDVKATFFVVGQNLEKYPEVGRAIVGGGHTIGNHSYSHDFIKYLKDPSFKSEIDKTQNVIMDITGKSPSLYRSPWLFQNSWLMKTVVGSGLVFVSGRFGSQSEIRGRPAEKIAEDAVRIVKPGMILIFHDGYDAKGADRSQTVKAIDLLIPKLKNLGYSLVTVDNLLGIAPYKII